MIFFFTCFSVKGDISSELVKEGKRLAAEKVDLDGLFLKIKNQKRILQEKGAPVFAEAKEVNSKRDTLNREIDEWNSKYGNRTLPEPEYNYANTLRQPLERRNIELKYREAKISSDPMVKLAIAQEKDIDELKRRYAQYDRDKKAYDLKLNLESKAMTQARKISKGMQTAEGFGTNE